MADEPDDRLYRRWIEREDHDRQINILIDELVRVQAERDSLLSALNLVCSSLDDDIGSEWFEMALGQDLYSRVLASH